MTGTTTSAHARAWVLSAWRPLVATGFGSRLLADRARHRRLRSSASLLFLAARERLSPLRLAVVATAPSCP